MSPYLRIVAGLVAFLLGGQALAGEAFFCVPLRELKFAEGGLPGVSEAVNWRLAARARAMPPEVVLDGPGEAYIGLDDTQHDPPSPSLWLEQGELAVRVPDRKDVTGRLIFPKNDSSGMMVRKFTIPAAQAKSPEEFYLVQQLHYERLLRRGIPGGAWFRHQARQAQLARNFQVAEKPGLEADPDWSRSGEVLQTYDIFTGGRAISENLQLDRVLKPTAADRSLVKIDSLRGITVPEINWGPLIKDLKPELDPLSARLPADQHVVFFPNFGAAVTIADHVAEHGTALLRLAEVRAEETGIAARYQRQLGLSVHGFGRLLGPRVIRSVALTGSDPYFPTGTDVAILFETPEPRQLAGLLQAQITLATATNGQAKWSSGEVAGLAYRGVRSPDRSLCSYLAELDGAVVVSNSLYQLERLASVRQGQSPALATLPEYVFFRHRYRRGDPEETAFVLLTDAAIRRWCGPRWRIGNSRRTRDAAVLAQVQAEHLDRLVRQTGAPGPIQTALPLSVAGDLTLTRAGVASTSLGTLGFLTPIAELPLEQVTKSEADAYAAWRAGYERLWGWAFDPIALRLSVQREALAADVSVMPLVVQGQYREIMAVSQGARLSEDAGDRHPALAHLMVAIDPRSYLIQLASGVIKSQAQMPDADPLDWFGRAVEFFADEDPFWQDFAKLSETEREELGRTEMERFPLALRLASTDRQKLLAALPALRACLKSLVGSSVQRESRTYRDQVYERHAGSQELPAPPQKYVLYWAALDDALLITPNEDVLKRAIDRQIARRAAKADGQPAAPPSQPWLGSTVCLKVQRPAVELGLGFTGEDNQASMQARAWGNLPILNEWKRRYPDQDAVALHERFWHTRLVCPGGGAYVWNERWQTFESTVYGHPGEPKRGPALPPAMNGLRAGNFGLTLEDRSLRARVVLERAPSGKPSGAAGSNGSGASLKLPEPAAKPSP